MVKIGDRILVGKEHLGIESIVKAILKQEDGRYVIFCEDGFGLDCFIEGDEDFEVVSDE